jgi:hypothetical protein
VPVPANALAKFKFKLKGHKSFSQVWTNKGSGAHNDLSIWCPELEGSALTLGKSKKSHERICVGHFPVAGFDQPKSRGGAQPMVLEVTDTSVQVSLLGGSAAFPEPSLNLP